MFCCGDSNLAIKTVGPSNSMPVYCDDWAGTIC
jgi:hypothetical protein